MILLLVANSNTQNNSVVETKEFIVFVRNVTVLLVMIMIQIETMKLLGVVLFGTYYLTTISKINMEMQFGD